MSARMIVLTMAGMLVLSVSAMAADEKEPTTQSGTMTGTVTEKGETWIRVKDAEGNSERFMPRWIGGAPKDGGGLDKEMLKQIAAVKAGDKVEVKWTFDERKRVVELKVLAE